jgi:hypothetical protein
MILFKDKKLCQLFINFLKENGIYKSYITEKFRFEVYNNIIHTSVCDNPKMYIMGAFIFFNTRQGWEFWRKMNEKWIQTLEKYLNKN